MHLYISDTIFCFIAYIRLHNENLHLKNLLYYSNTSISINETDESPLREWGFKLLVKGGITLKDNEFKRRLEGSKRTRRRKEEARMSMRAQVKSSDTVQAARRTRITSIGGTFKLTAWSQTKEYNQLYTARRKRNALSFTYLPKQTKAMNSSKS